MRVVVIGACGPAGVNVCRALHAADHEVIGLDENRLHLPFGAPYARTILAPPVGDDLARLVDELHPDAVHAQPTGALTWLSARDWPVCLPDRGVLEIAFDKPRALNAWYALGLRKEPSMPIAEPFPDRLHLARDRFGLPFWLRASAGSGARGATLVESLAGGYHWLRYWQSRGTGWQWIAEEYLPGRDYCWTSLWQHGQLIASFSRERLEWIYPHLAPSGRTGTPVASMTVHDARLNRVGRKAVLALDKAPHGIYCVDLREDTEGRPRPTEVNAGRWATTSPLYSSLGLNLPDLHAAAAAGEQLEIYGDDVYPPGQYLLRHIDCGTGLYSEVAEPGLAATA